MNKNPGIMERIASYIVDKRVLISLLFAAAAVFCVFSRNWVKVNDSLTDYLPDTTETRRGLDLMEREFTSFGSAEVMVENITLDQAYAIQNSIEDIEGVKSVEFDETDEHYRSAAALFSVTFDGLNDDIISVEALKEVKEKLSSYDLYVYSTVGNPLKNKVAEEMLIVDGIAALIIFTVLTLTSSTYGEIPVLLITFGAAALLNMGTNFLMGEISFVTDSIAIVLQLALAIDYAVILYHRYMEEREKNEPREAAIVALTKAIPEISASCLTTIAGLLALCFMEYDLGKDLGSVMIKAILLSIVSVFLLMPGLLVFFSKIIDKTHHKSFVPKVTWLGKFDYATRYIMPVVFVGIIIAAYVFFSRATYVYDQYSVKSMRLNETQLAERRIDSVFSKNVKFAIMVPAGDYTGEEEIVSEIEELDDTVEVLSLAGAEIEGYRLTDELNSRQFAELTGLDNEVVQLFYAGYSMSNDSYAKMLTNRDNYSVSLIDMASYLLDEKNGMSLSLTEETADELNELEEKINDAKIQLKSDDWSRIVVESDLPTEGEASFDYLSILRGIVARHYRDFYIVGDTTSCSDLKASFEKDNVLISILSIGFVVAVLVFTFKSAGLSFLLILIIQGSIYCNFSQLYLKGDKLFFLTYLIISAIQMGANIDYAIVISSRYMELKEELPLKEAMMETLNLSFPTVITSGMILSLAGFAIALVTTNESISTIGYYLGSGTLISVILVLCVLPQILLLGDIIIQKTSFSVSYQHTVTKVGAVRIDGRVRGNISGYVDAEIHGTLRGEVNAVITMGNAQNIDSNIESVSIENGGSDK